MPIFFVIPQDRSNATSSCAGLFIAAHLGFETTNQWIHVDIAGPSHYVNKVVLLIFI